MPYKYKDPYRHKFEAARYKVTNWHEYNQALIERGNITIWFDKKTIKSGYAEDREGQLKDVCLGKAHPVGRLATKPHKPHQVQDEGGDERWRRENYAKNS